MDSQITDDKFFNFLVGIIIISIQNKKTDDAEKLLDAMRALRPAVRELDLYEAWIRMSENNLLGANYVLRSLMFDRPALETARAFLAICLFGLGDNEWISMANEIVLHGTDADAKNIARGLLEPLPGHQEPVRDTESTTTTSVSTAEMQQCSFAMRA